MNILYSSLGPSGYLIQMGVVLFMCAVLYGLGHLTLLSCYTVLCWKEFLARVLMGIAVITSMVTLLITAAPI